MAEFKCTVCGQPSANIYYDDEGGKNPYKCASCSLRTALNTANDADIGRAVKAYVGQGLTWLRNKVGL